MRSCVAIMQAVDVRLVFAHFRLVFDYPPKLCFEIYKVRFWTKTQRFTMAEWSNAPDLNSIQLSGLLGGSGSNPDGEDDFFCFFGQSSSGTSDSSPH
jgi:hypothetical protein